MKKTLAAVSNFLSIIPGQIYLWLAVIIFATANSVTRKLTEIGSQHLIDGRNPISFCNVLFVGNICALLVLILIYQRQLSVRSFRQFSLKYWGSMATVALLSGALAPGVIFEALSLTMVNNVVLVGRIEPPLTLALSIWLLGERTNGWEIAGAIVSFIGVVVTLVLQGLWGNTMAPAGFGTVGWGEILTAVGAVAVAVSNIISKASLDRIPIGIFTIVRTALGTIIFFFTALYLYGSHHFVTFSSTNRKRYGRGFSTSRFGAYCFFGHHQTTDVSNSPALKPSTVCDDKSHRRLNKYKCMFNLSSLKILPTRGDVPKTLFPGRTAYLQFSWFSFPRCVLSPLLRCIKYNIILVLVQDLACDSRASLREGCALP